METRSRFFDPELWEESGASLLSTYKFNGHDWQTVQKDRTRILCKVAGRGQLRNEQFGFRAKHSTTLQFTRLIERMSRNLGKKWLPGASFLNVAKAFDSVWVFGLFYKQSFIYFREFFKKISSYFNSWTFEVSFQTAMPISHRLQAGVAQGGIISPVLFRLYVNSMPLPFRHVELALYADDMAVSQRCSFNIWRHLSDVESG